MRAGSYVWGSKWGLLNSSVSLFIFVSFTVRLGSLYILWILTNRIPNWLVALFILWSHQPFFDTDATGISYSPSQADI